MASYLSMIRYCSYVVSIRHAKVSFHHCKLSPPYMVRISLTHIQSHATCLCLVVCILQFQCHNIILCTCPGMGSWKNNRLHRWEIQIAEWEQQAAFRGIQRTQSWTCMHYVVGLTHPRLISCLHPGLVAYCSIKIYTWKTLVVAGLVVLDWPLSPKYHSKSIKIIESLSVQNVEFWTPKLSWMNHLPHRQENTHYKG